MKTTIEKLWTIEDVAEFFQVKVSVVKYWLYNLNLPYIKLGKHHRFDPKDLKAWIEIQKNGGSIDNTELKKIM